MRLTSEIVQSGEQIQKAIDDAATAATAAVAAAAIAWDNLKDAKSVDFERDTLLIRQNEENHKISVGHFADYLAPPKISNLPPDDFDATLIDIRDSCSLGDLHNRHVSWTCQDADVTINISDYLDIPVYLHVYYRPQIMDQMLMLYAGRGYYSSLYLGGSGGDRDAFFYIFSGWYLPKFINEIPVLLKL